MRPDAVGKTVPCITISRRQLQSVESIGQTAQVIAGLHVGAAALLGVGLTGLLNDEMTSRDINLVGLRGDIAAIFVVESGRPLEIAAECGDLELRLVRVGADLRVPTAG